MRSCDKPRACESANLANDDDDEQDANAPETAARLERSRRSNDDDDDDDDRGYRTHTRRLISNLSRSSRPSRSRPYRRVSRFPEPSQARNFRAADAASSCGGGGKLEKRRQRARKLRHYATQRNALSDKCRLGDSPRLAFDWSAAAAAATMTPIWRATHFHNREPLARGRRARIELVCARRRPDCAPPRSSPNEISASAPGRAGAGARHWPRLAKSAA